MEPGSPIMSKTKRLIFFAMLFSIALHAFVIVCIVFADRSDSHSRLWSGGQGDGSYDVAFVELGDLKVVSGGPMDSMDKMDMMDKAGKKIAIKQKGLNQQKKPNGAMAPQSGKGNSNTPAGGVGNGLDVTGASADNAPSVIAEIRKRIAQHKTFPAEARKNGWEGEVGIQFQINAQGQLAFVKVVKSSGHEILDVAALETIAQAAPFPYFPDVILVPVEYQLR